jgi:hypothetical protein
MGTQFPDLGMEKRDAMGLVDRKSADDGYENEEMNGQEGESATDAAAKVWSTLLPGRLHGQPHFPGRPMVPKSPAEANKLDPVVESCDPSRLRPRCVLRIARGLCSLGTQPISIPGYASSVLAGNCR